MAAGAKPTYSIRDIPPSVWVLGFVSMFMDISSEMIHALLPIYLVTVLGASMITHASFLDQAHSLKLELAGKLPSLHDPPPAPSKHLTRCLGTGCRPNSGQPVRRRVRFHFDRLFDPDQYLASVFVVIEGRLLNISPRYSL